MDAQILQETNCHTLTEYGLRKIIEGCNTLKDFVMFKN